VATRRVKPRPANEPTQGALFGDVISRNVDPGPRRKPADAKPTPGSARWQMPEMEGHTVAEVRLRWGKRLSPGQVARIETELGALPQLLEKLGYGPVELERSFVRRRR